ncbi:helix-turn-helix domain-containing protein [Ornithinibacillus halotolerans]|uniref:MerR family transcriptional regulator n=1 Tax=Ornithinibacillus halotolerans TaxID=1274357 RepID=A0A916SAJ4_9BACI|nr:XRE family transcriptional regulator [Ornithinibacillus halotolerans]GGA91251.1 MerR family transcriptional regulator [Ornithinibacillus halotolerans]
MNIGIKIRELRTEKNMSLKELAELSNCTPSFISQIERDVANPSINTLKKISEVLRVPLVSFFEEPTQQREDFIVKKGDRIKLHSPSEKSEVYLLSPSHIKKDIEMHMIIIEPGGRSDQLYVNETEEVGYILEGELTLLLGDESYEVEAGDSIYFPGSLPHGWVNESNARAVTLWAASPPIINTDQKQE